MRLVIVLALAGIASAMWHQRESSSGIVDEAVVFGKEHLSANQSSTVILIPGLAGTRLTYKFSNPPIDDRFCRSTGSGVAWLELESIVPITAKCVMSRLQMRWSGKEWIDLQGVNVSIVPGIAGVAYLDPSNAETRDVTSYFAGTIAALTAAKRPFTTANYDWRKGCLSIANWRTELQKQIETIVSQTGIRVTLVAHSMGCMQTSFFLATMTSVWKQTYIHAFVSAGISNIQIVALIVIFHI